ncbi:MAG: GmrSD restriction endonuclease domain-containing protein [Pirellulales bacterium]
MSDLKTCFKKVDYDLSGLLHYIDIGDIGLPDIQRPFVWSNAKVRDLFDSMYRGFPVGYLLFWENGNGNGAKQIGFGGKQHAMPSRLIVDGQQRLTSLFAVFRGKKILDEDYRERQIEVAFRPRDGKFEVADAAIRKDPEWIHNISGIWASGKPSYQMVKAFLKQVEAKGPITEEDESLIAHNLDRLFDLQKYPFTSLEIASTVDEEQVADIFVRINSEGVRLNQADFILTLMSVFWDEGRMALETFCRLSRKAPDRGAPASPFNHFIQPDPDQLLRVAVGLGFNRGRIKSVYQILRGKDMDTGEFSSERRDAQFKVLQDAQAQVLNLTCWHQFLSCLVGAGFRSGELVSSKNALLYAYVFYLIGKIHFGLAEHRLQKLIGRWFFASSLTGRYTGSPETVMDGDLNRLKEAQNPDSFAGKLEEMMANELTNDFWNVTLPANLDSSSARNPELFAYVAAQNRLGAPVLFSHKKVHDLLDPAIKTKKKALERHHLFPRGWLESQGVEDLKKINQVANFALLEWPENIGIADEAPSAYVPRIEGRFSPEEWAGMHNDHALPKDWHLMRYETFLQERRKLMAAIIRRGFETLG